jgi:acyl carrier protein
MNLQIKSIQQDIARIMRTKLNVPDSVLAEENWSLPLTGKIFRLSAVDLTYLFLEAEKAYGIRIDESELTTYGFNSIKEIADTVLKCKEQA